MSDYLSYLKDLVKEAIKAYPKAALDRMRDLPLTGRGGVRQLLGEVSLKFFAQAYFPQYFRHKIPEFHEEAYSELDAALNKPPSGARIVRIWPRSNAKSTIYNFFAPTKAALYAQRRFSVQISESETQAEGFLGDIKAALEQNDHIVEDFGDVRGAIWRADQIEVKAANGTVVRIGAAGAGSSIRGMKKGEFRPDMIVLDDIEGDESVLTQDRINKLHTWFNRAVMNLGEASTDVVVVGTIMAYDCVLDRLARSPSWDVKRLSAVRSWSTSPLWDDWRKIYTDLSLPKDERKRLADEFYVLHEQELLEGVEVLWPEGRPYKSLMEVYVDIGEAAFYAEHQNEPVNLEEAIIKPDWVTYYDQRHLDSIRILEYYGAIDPSMGKSKLSDYTAIIILGRGDDGFIYVVDAIVERMHPDKILETLLHLGKEYQFVRFGIEVNQWQDLLRVMLIEKSARAGMFLPIVELRHNKDKVIRVQALIPYIKNGYIRFNRDHRLLIEQMLGFPKLRYDDAIDCLEMAVRLARFGPASDSFMTGTAPGDGRRYRDDDDEDGLPRRTFFS